MSEFYPVHDEPQLPRPPPKIYPSKTYDVTNPGARVKFLYPLATTHCIGIEPGQTLSGVRVADHVVAQLRNMQDELIFKPSSNAMPDVVQAIPLGAGDEPTLKR